MFPTAGIYSVRIGVTDTANLTMFATSSISIVEPYSIIAAPVAISGGLGTTPFSGPVATFATTRPNSSIADFSAVIQWGDGSSSPGDIKGGPSSFTVSGSHPYESAGTFTTSISIVGVGDAPSGSTMGTATITAPSSGVTASGRTFVASAGQTINSGAPADDVVIATFTDPSPTAVGTYSALIDWGGGRTGPGAIRLEAGTSDQFEVRGTISYDSARSYPVKVAIYKSGSPFATASSTAQVVNTGASFSFTAGLAIAPGNGPNAANGYTLTNRPTFAGTATPYATVQLYARPTIADATIPIGSGVADGSGAWSVQSTPLADGAYAVTAVQTPPAGYPGEPVSLAANQGRVVVDTVAPQVVGVATDRSGRVTVLFRDESSGMDASTLHDAGDYALLGKRSSVIRPTSATLESVGASPTDAAVVSLALPGGRRTRSAFGRLRIDAAAAGGAGATDLAGNAVAPFVASLGRGRTVKPAARRRAR
ncbi:Ig-like domain-containing protein [Paludisphaera mucosa]|uniref:Ig-like domain-containing protein n=1 Tax=Paludisphaera mucosa TaxID=3030827 RepID=A0ABT6FL39_9BACT|nr:Ig-like domain-containing protein [Paludisphaera mucosa]